MIRIFSRLRSDERGATAVEFAMICGMIMLVMIGAVKGFADETTELWDDVKSKSKAAIDGS